MGDLRHVHTPFGFRETAPHHITNRIDRPDACLLFFQHSRSYSDAASNDFEAEVGPETRVTITVLLNVALLPDGRGDLAHEFVRGLLRQAEGSCERWP